MNFFMEYMNNLGSYAVWVAILLTVLGALIGVTAYEARPKTQYGSVEYSNYTYQMWTSLQGVILMWVLVLAILAVPSPNYIYRTKTVDRIVYKDRIVPKNVVRTVYRDKVEKYAQAFDRCYASASTTKAGCHVIALYASNPKLNTRVVYKKDPYRTLFNTCMGKDLIETGWGLDEEAGQVDGRQLRTERIALCHKQVMEARKI